MDNKNKTIFLAISIMFIICTCFTSLSFSYFINPSTTETDVLTSSLVSNELTYDENRILAPNETRVVTLNITSYNSFDSYESYHNPHQEQRSQRCYLLIH